MSLPADPRKSAAANHGGGSSGETGRRSSTNPTSDEVVLATAGYDHTIKFWQAHSGKCIKTLQHTDSQVNALVISPDGQVLAAAGYQHIRMFDLNSITTSPLVNYEGVSKNVMGLGFHEEGRWMYTGGEDGTAKIWDLRMHNLQCQKIFHAKSAVNSVVLHPNQYELIIGDQDGKVHVWNLRTETSESVTPEPGASIQSVAIDRQGNFVAAVTYKGTCYVSSSLDDTLEPETNVFNQQKRLIPHRKIIAHERYALRCQFSPDSTLLATTSADQTCKLWNVSNLSLVAELFVENQRWVWDVAFSADNHYLFTASSDHLVRLWSIPGCQGGKPPRVKRVYEEDGHQKAVICVAFRDASATTLAGR